MRHAHQSHSHPLSSPFPGISTNEDWTLSNTRIEERPLGELTLNLGREWLMGGRFWKGCSRLGPQSFQLSSIFWNLILSKGLCRALRGLLKEVVAWEPNAEWKKYSVESLRRPAWCGTLTWSPSSCSPCFSHTDHPALPWGGWMPSISFLYACLAWNILPAPASFVWLAFSLALGLCKVGLLRAVLPVIFYLLIFFLALFIVYNMSFISLHLWGQKFCSLLCPSTEHGAGI